MLINSLIENDLFGAIEPFRPVIDGIEFRAQPLTLFKNGMWQTDKELIIGTAQEEMAYIEALFEKANINLTCRLFKVRIIKLNCFYLRFICFSMIIK